MAQKLDTMLDCSELAKAVAVVTDSTSSQLQRSVAQHICDEFKEKSPHYLTLGLELAESTGKAPVRLFGFQAIEHFIKSRWDNMAWVGRSILQDRFMKLISNLATPILEEDSRIKETIVRIMMEMIKRNWPEKWSMLFSELNVLCGKGLLHAELVMRTLLEMVQDTITVLHARTPVLQRALFSNICPILEVVRILLRDTIVDYKLKKLRPNLPSPIEECCVIRATLKTLAGYMNWIDVSHITENNFQLLDLLWCLLTDPELQLEVAECVLIAFNRVGALPSSKPLLVLFEYVAAPKIFPVIQTTVGEVLTERHYYFLNTLCQLTCIFGEQLCRTLGLNGCVKSPSNFDKYLDNLLEFTTHGSQRLSFLTQSTWRELFSHKLLSSDSHLLSILPKYLLSTRTKLLKRGFPSKNNSLACDYSRFDFATDEDFCVFLTNFRDEQKLAIDAACQLDKVACFQTTMDWLKHLMVSSVNTESSHSPSPDGWYNQEDTDSYLEWEAIIFFIKVIITNMLRNVKNGSTIVNYGIEMLQLLLNFKTKDPLVLSCIPSIMVTLLPFLDLKSELKNGCLPQVLARLLEIVEDIKAPKAPPLSGGRRIALFSINQICRDNPEIYLPSFQMLYSHVKQLLCDELLQLTQIEKCLLMESAVILMNQFKNYEQQKTYLEELIAPVTSLWLSEEIQRVFADPKAFVSYVGADLPASETVGDSPTDLNRSGIIHCVATILGVLKWTSCPMDLESAKAGGFIDASSGKLVFRNPCTNQVLKLLDNILVLIRTHHNLFLPEILSKICDRFPLTLDLLDVKNVYSLNVGWILLDLYELQEHKTFPERMQGFFSALYGCCLYIVGCAASTLKEEYYATNDLVNKLHKCVFQNLENIPDYGLLSIVRFFLRPFVSACSPKYYRTLVCPVLAASLPYLHARLSQKWNFIDEGDMAKKRKTESYEMQLKLKRLLTEEVIEFVIECCMPTNLPNVTSGTNVNKKSLHIQDATSKDGDVFIASPAAESNICRLSNVDADTAVCTAESDDDDCLTNADEQSSAVAAVNNALCSVLHQKPDSSVIGEDSDLARSLPCGNAYSVVKHDNLLSRSSEDAYPNVVPTKEISNFLLSANASVMPLDADDSEIAAEAPQPGLHVFPKSSVSERPQITKLGMCLIEDEAVRSTLLSLAYSSLVWKDSCSREATRLCWPLLQQVILEPLLADTVTHLFTMTLKGLYLHRHDPFLSEAIDRLAFKMYESLRPQYIELKEVMKQVPHINLFDLETFDDRLLEPKKQITYNKLRQYFKDLIKNGIQD